MPSSGLWRRVDILLTDISEDSSAFSDSKMLVLLMGGIYDVRQRDGFRWCDTHNDHFKSCCGRGRHAVAETRAL
jgi:hypothetical protein